MDFSALSQKYLALIDQTLLATLEKSLSPELAEMISYHYRTGGKRLRPLAVFFAAESLGNVAVDRILPFSVAVEMIHNATLIHDDIQDGDTLRRGQATLWQKYSLAQGINCGDALFFAAEEVIQDAGYEPALTLALLRLVQTKTKEVIEGQALEFVFKERLRDDGAFPSEADYKKMVVGKTSALFSMPILGGALLAGKELSHDLDAACAELGYAFQIRDDYIDLWGEKGRAQRGSDIAEGKLSYPFILALGLWDSATRERACQILRAERSNTLASDVAWVIAAMERVGVREATLEKVNGILARVGGMGAGLDLAPLAESIRI